MAKKQVFSPEELGLLNAIHADPKNDTLRLVYADWLEERGDPLGEFMRLQVAHKFGFAYGDENDRPPRERELAKLHKWEWLRPLPRNLRPRFCIRGLPRLQFRVDVNTPRVRLEQMSRLEQISPEDLDATLEAVNPRVRFAMVCCETSALAGLLQHCFFARVDTLGIVVGPERQRSTGSRVVSPDVITTVAGCPYLRNFEKVQMDLKEVGDRTSDEMWKAIECIRPGFLIENEVDLQIPKPSIYHRR